MPLILRPGNYALVMIQELFNKVFNTSLNPLYFLGSITFLFLWTLIVTGVYLFLFYEMNPVGAYESVRYMTEDQKYYGGIMRSLHRYASDGIVISIIVHMIQVFFSDRFRKYRWVAWVSGAAIIPVIWFEGVSGYLLVWDETAQMIALIGAELFNVAPLNVEPLQRAFLVNNSVNATFFFVMNYLHLAIPILILIIAWIHCMRVSMPLILPRWPITGIILASLLLLSIIKPAVSAPPADLSRLIGEAPVDWFYLSLFPFIYWLDISPESVWMVGGGGFIIFALSPWLIRDPKKSSDDIPTVPQNAISFEEDKCKGCLLCQAACPFEALQIVEGKDPDSFLPVVTPGNCAECGFCVSICEFDAVAMGEWKKSTFHEYIDKLLSAEGESGAARTVSIAFICERSFNQDGFYNSNKTRLARNDEVAVMIVPCIGVISPTIVEYSLKAGAKGVMVVGCRGLDCHYREERRRIKVDEAPERQKFLVEQMDNPGLKVMLISPFEIEQLERDIDQFNATVKRT
jgi:quinol-cytochrome oxidoreductase complex cytochrome b subunit/coenzyme F420-reducing hydrogenase delta subunit